MMNQKTRARLTFEALRAATIAMLIGILGMAFTLLMMGAGHGTMAPALYLFSPIMLLCMILGDHSMAPTVLVLGSLVLYVVYGVVLTIGRHGEQGRSTVSWILGIHYFSAALAIPFAQKYFIGPATLNFP